MREFAKSQKNMAKVKRGNLQWFDINHLAKKKIMDPHNFFAELFSSPRVGLMFAANLFPPRH